MTQNLNYNAAGSLCYDDNTANCDKYGRLYDWNTALTVAPDGWHLPSNEEWTTLTDFLGGISVAGGAMKDKTTWSQPNVGATNSSGFSGLPGGNCYKSGSGIYLFNYKGDYGYWWSSTEYNLNPLDAWCRNLGYGNTLVNEGFPNKTQMYSIRCIKN